MAWQTPKTDWTGSDGVRNTDFNRIEGNILELYNNSAIRADSTIYVSTSGNDTTGNGTAATPYKTLYYALNSIPKNLNGKAVAIDVATGVYDEAVVIKGFSGPIILKGVYGRTATIRSLFVEGCTCVVQSLVITATGTITVTNGGTFISGSNVSANGGTYGISILNGSSCVVDSALNVYDSTSAAIYVSGVSSCYALSIGGSGAAAVATVEKGSTLAFGSTNLTVNALQFIARSGGRVYSGAQSNVPNY